MAALLMSLFLLFFGIQQQEPPSPGNLSGDPNAILLHELMMATLHEAKSLSFESTHCLYSVKDGDKQHSSTSNYKAWLMKPNYARLEVYRRGQDLYGVLVGDGDFFWLYWPNGTAFFTSAYTGVQGETEHNVYMKKPTPVGMHSLAHEICYLGASGMSVLELSSFHRYVDSLNPYLEEIKSEGEEEIAGTACDVIRLRFMKGQRERLLWLSRQDHLPRKLR
ncbi:MAG: hypothetical protein SWE60_25160, partial [Thermodesulfobacteriota bacterium]|nr:hypothetical protein [Thermodesulfobacteriota bacterium]